MITLNATALKVFFLQKIGTAMGTSFSVLYATIFMIWLETPILYEFQEHIKLYKRYIDDIFLCWAGSLSELCRLREKFATANINIKLEWQGTPPAQDTTNADNFDFQMHQKVNFLDLEIKVLLTEETQCSGFLGVP